MSIVENTSLLIVPGSIVPGHQATDGTRKPPSHVEALLPINEDLVFLWLPKGEFTQYPFFVRFFTFLLLLEKVCAFSFAVL